MGERDPLTRQRSTWKPLEPLLIDGVTTATYQREVGDGRLAVLVAEEPDGWHLSISHRRPTSKGPKYVRYPRWDEIAAARDEFLPADLSFVMVLPAAGDYVAEHKTTFHLHELNDWLLQRERMEGPSNVALPEQAALTAAAQAEAAHYFSTYCIHDDHEHCRVTCKTCQAPCRCRCHR